MVNQEKLLKQIKLLSDSIREKNRALKSDISNRELFLEKTFKPVTEPLRKLVNMGKPPILFEGDTISPISKYEKEKQSDEEREEFQDINKFNNLETTEEESEESEEVDTARQNKSFSISEENDEGEQASSNLSMIGSDIKHKGKLGRKYFVSMLHSTQPNRKYHIYGARVDGAGVMIGDSVIEVTANDDIVINGNMYKGTKGLFELIFKQNPESYSNKDLIEFKNILEDTNAHRKNYLKDSKIYRNVSTKYKNIISHLFPPKRREPVKRKAISTTQLNVIHKKRKTNESSTSGKGLMKNLYNTNIIYYNDVNKLVDRMRLLHEAKEAGHTGLDNEWVALVDELRNRGIIES